MIAEKQIEYLYIIYLTLLTASRSPSTDPVVATDSRRVTPGSMFFALKGDSFDGNRFAEAALNNGAACAVVDDESVVAEYAAANPDVDSSSLFFVTDNVLETLQALAAHHRKVLGIPILAITGTNGKTTTKELIRAVMARKFNVYSTQGNLNNHIGVPLTLLSMNGATRFGVVEMGASSQGEIALLSRIAAPDLGLITNIGRAHLEGFGGEDGVRRGKGELYDWLAASGGTAIVRSDDPMLTRMAAQRAGLKAEYYDIHYADGMKSRLAGDYNKANIAAAVAVGRLLGIHDDQIRDAIWNYEPDNNRSQFIDTGNNIVLADCYNANPSSMAAALDNFASGDPPIKNGIVLKKAAILGDMMELGEWSGEEHDRIVKMTISSGLDRIIFVGADFSDAVSRLMDKNMSGQVTKNLVGGESGSVKILPDTEALKEYLAAANLKGYTILLKGSHAMKMEEAIGFIK